MVETFINPEHECLIVDPVELEKWHGLVKKLGLTKQIRNESEKSPIPFPAMTAEQIAVYRALCPNECKISEFDKETIPLRVLEIADLCVTENYFSYLKVWHNYTTLDPILVGQIGEYEWSPRGYFLIARWGDELRSFMELKALALKTLIETKTNALTVAVSNAKTQLETVEYLAKHQLDGNTVSWAVQ